MAKTIKPGKKVELKKLELTEDDLGKLAEAGTKEAIEKIEAYLISERDHDKSLMAEMALAECEFNYYQPNNEVEDDEFLLCVIMNIHEKNILDCERELAEIENILEKNKIELAVHKKVIAKHKNKKEDWEFRYSDEDMVDYQALVEDINDDILYEKAWIEAAKSSIKTKKYKDGIPARHLEHYDFNFGDDEWMDDDCNCGCDCGYDCDCDDWDCPDCLDADFDFDEDAKII